MILNTSSKIIKIVLRALIKDKELHVSLDFLPDSREFISVFYLDWLIIRDFYIHLYRFIGIGIVALTLHSK
jgi:hypothetical protein